MKKCMPCIGAALIALVFSTVFVQAGEVNSTPPAKKLRFIFFIMCYGTL